MDNINMNESEKLFAIKKNQLKMVARRGYDIEKEEGLLDLELQDFLNIYVPFATQKKKTLRETLSVLYLNESGDRLYVHLADYPQGKQKLGVDDLKEFINQMDHYKCKNGILISPKDLSPQVKKEIEKLVSYNIYTFLESEMTYDPTEHVLNPKFRGMESSEQRDFLSRNNLSIDQIPVFLTSDIIVRYYGFKPGQVVEIDRTNVFGSLVENSLSYRVVQDLMIPYEEAAN